MARHLTAVNLLGFFGYYKSRWGAVVTPTRGVQLLRRWSLPWVAALAQSALRRIRPGLAAAAPGETFNPARREAEDGEAPSAGGLPSRLVERAHLEDALRRLPAARVQRLCGAALEAALPFRTASEPGEVP
jgi:hypothetical protein